MKINKKQRAEVVKAYLDTIYPNPGCELDFGSTFQLLVAVILSAQCTDKRVNLITPTLFARFSTAKDFLNATQAEVEEIIHSCGFFSQKAKAILQASKDIVEKFDGKVPDKMEQLLTLRGVGRKTANVVLSVAYGVPSIAVDTHVLRMAKRFGLSDSQNPVKVEKDLMKLFAKEDWSLLHYQLVLYGRYNSKARGKSDWEQDFLTFEKNFLEKNKKTIKKNEK